MVRLAYNRLGQTALTRPILIEIVRSGNGFLVYCDEFLCFGRGSDVHAALVDLAEALQMLRRELRTEGRRRETTLEHLENLFHAA